MLELHYAGTRRVKSAVTVNPLRFKGLHVIMCHCIILMNSVDFAYLINFSVLLKKFIIHM
jgi:hypothetical protein